LWIGQRLPSLRKGLRLEAIELCSLSRHFAISNEENARHVYGAIAERRTFSRMQEKDNFISRENKLLAV